MHMQLPTASKPSRSSDSALAALTQLCIHICLRFTSDSREEMPAADIANVTITTFTMISHGGKRSKHGEEIMNQIKNRDWGLLLLDEVHVVPAQMFRKV